MAGYIKANGDFGFDVANIDFLNGVIGIADFIDGNDSNNTLNGTAGADLISGYGGDDKLDGKGGNDTLYGYDGNDTLVGGTGNDWLEGDEGSDTYLFTAGDGKDTINNYDYDNSVDVVKFTGVASTQVGTVRVGGSTGNDFVIALGGTDSLTVYEGWYGGDNAAIDHFQFSDGVTWTWADIKARSLLGTAGADTLHGFNGEPNTINGQGGNDTLNGGDQSDSLDGGDGADTLYGYAGNDSLVGGTGNDELYGGDGNDTLIGDTGNDWLSGDAGGDAYLFSAGDGKDTLYNYDSDNSVDVVKFTGVASTQVGTIRLGGSTGNDFLIPLGGTDSLTVYQGWYGGDYAIDQFQFSDGVTWTWADIKARSLLGTAGADTLWGFDGEPNTITGQGGNDELNGGDQSDSLDGGDGNDQLSGGSAGNDTLAGGTGNDWLEGGEGSDTYLFSAGDGKDTLYNYDADNSVDVVKFTGVASTQVGKITYGGSSGASLVIALGGTDQIEIYSGWYGGDYAVDQFQFSDGVTWTWADIKAKSLVGTSGADTLWGFNGEPNTINGQGGNDALYGGDGNDALDGGDGADYLDGYAGNDSLDGGAGDDAVYGYGGTDTLAGGTGNDDLRGMDGNDTLNGGTGNDYLEGNEGADTYLFANGDGTDTINNYDTDNAKDTIKFTDAKLIDLLAITRNADDLVIDLASGDQITVSSHFTSAEYRIDKTQFADGSTLTNFVVGTAAKNTLNGTTGNDAISGLGDADSMSGKGGDDLYFVDNTGDVVNEIADAGTDTVLTSTNYGLPDNVENLALQSGAATGTGNSLNNLLTGNSVANTLTGLGGNDTLRGGAGSDSLSGGDGNDSLDGGAGNDQMQGGTGDDTYLVANDNDLVTENPNEGIDTIQSSVVDWTLPAQVENLSLLGGAATGTGNSLANTITGNDANNTLDGAQGADSLMGGKGDDTYLVDAADTVAENPGEGTDTVKAGFSYALGDDLENLVLTGTAATGTGNGLANTITGNDANNTLDGAQGADSLMGGKGDDTYLVDHSGDAIAENLNEGIDTALSGVDYTLPDHVENLTLTGAALVATGNSLANTLTGNDANNTLNGTGGVDAMQGGLGDDLYMIDNSGDIIVENANAGLDAVSARASYALPANVENLTLAGGQSLTGTGNTLANLLVGNGSLNTLTGLKGNDILDGKGGADTLTGNLGNDKYVVDNPGDLVVESANEGIDTVSSGITYVLPADVENLTLNGTAIIDGTGNELPNTLTGNAAVNILEGGLGDDSLNGGGGADTLKGGDGNDTYIVDNTGDVLVENANEGIDTAQSNVTYTLSANVENLTLTGKNAISGIGNDLPNTLVGNAKGNLLDGGKGADILTGGGGADAFVLGGGGADADKVSDFVSGSDKVRLLDGPAFLNIGDGDHVIDGKAAVAGPGGFSNAAELVIVTHNIVGNITASAAATAIGSATSAYAAGDTRLFAVDNGTDSALFLFKSAGADATVDATELTLVGTLQGTPQTALGDYLFA